MKGLTLLSFISLIAASSASAAAAENFPEGPYPKADGYRGIWYSNQPSNDEFVYKYSGGLGTYCAKHIPHAIYAPEVDKTFFVYGGAGGKDDRSLLEMVSYYDHKTGEVPRPTILMDKQTSDAHDNPVILIDAKGHIWVFASSHGTSRPSYVFRSRQPYSIDSFEMTWKTNFSYPQPWYFEGRGILFIHTRYMNGRMLHWMTSPDGRTWSKPRRLAGIAQGHYQISRPWKTKAGTAFNYHPAGKGLNWRTNLYYLETADMGETWKNARGEAVETPLSSIGNKALVHDYESEKRLVYLKDINYDDAGRPVILFVTSGGYRSGPESGPRIWTTARWTGEEWDIHGSIESDNNYDMGSLYIEADGAWRIIAPTEPGPQRYNPGGEIAMWISRDRGGSWEKVRQMTRGSEYNHTYVRRPVNAHPTFYGFWADGHGRKPSDSRLYFCNEEGDVFRLPVKMEDDHVKPERVE